MCANYTTDMRYKRPVKPLFELQILGPKLKKEKKRKNPMAFFFVEMFFLKTRFLTFKFKIKSNR